MNDPSENFGKFKDFTEFLYYVKSLLFKGAILATIPITFKKIGLLTSLKMIFKSYFLPLGKLKPTSIRNDLISDLRRLVKDIEYLKGANILVIGEARIGKTLAIKTAFHHYGGVVNLRITDNNKITDTVLTNLLGGINNFFLAFFLKQSVSSIIFWHKMIINRPPIVILEIFNSPKNRVDYYNDVRNVSSYF